MTDRYVNIGGSNSQAVTSGGSVPQRLKDMGDGTFAPQVYTVNGGGSGGTSPIADSLVVDGAGVYWIIQDQGSGTFVYYNLSTLAEGTPTAPVTPASTSTGLQVVEQKYSVLTAGTGYAVGDVLDHVVILNVSTTPATVTASSWVNITQGTVLASAPTAANISATPNTVTSTQGAGASGNPWYFTVIGPSGNQATVDAAGSLSVKVNEALPAGSNVIGAVTQSGTWTVGLPSGASTSALQTTANTTLTTISGQLPASLGQKTTAASLSIGPASDAATYPFVVVGNVASGSTDSGAGVKVSGVFNSVSPTLSSGQRGDLQLNTNGQLFVAAATVVPVDAVSNSSGMAAFSSSARPVLTGGYLYNSSGWDRARTIAGSDGTGLGITASAPTPHTASTGAIVPVASAVSPAASGVVLKASAGNVYGVSAQQPLSGGVACFLVLYNATSIPASAASLTAANILKVWNLSATAGFAGWDADGRPPLRCSTGAVLIATTSLTTMTLPSTVPVFFGGDVV